MFPGDAILEVNGERIKYAPVEKVVEAITRVAPDTGEGGGSHHKSVSSSLVLQRIGTFINYCICNNTVMHNCENYTLLFTISNYGVTCKNNTGNEKLTRHIWSYNNHFKIIMAYRICVSKCKSRNI